MKKLIFLLLMAVALAGFVSALDTAHPPGGLTLEAALFGDGVDGCAVTPDMVLVSATLVTAELSSFPAVMALYNELAIQPQGGIIIYQVCHRYSDRLVQFTPTNYYLRC